MTTKSKIQYRIDKLRKYTGLNLKDDSLLNGKTHRLSIEFKDLIMDDVSLRYNSKRFLELLDSMIRLFEFMNNSERLYNGENINNPMENDKN